MLGSAEVICVGTELLLGEILNSNAQFLAQEFARLGIPHYYQTVVGDNVLRLQKTLAIACERSQIIVFTGGLGPTPDDLTTEAIADFFDTPLIEQADVLDDITQKFIRRGREMSPSNRKQALIPQGASVLPNRLGTAPGIIWQPRPNLTILTFPGVPREMKAMWAETAVPYLQSQGWGQTTIHSRTLRFWGISESGLAEQVESFLSLSNPTVAPYAGRGEVRLRISAKATSEEDAIALIDPVEAQLRQIGGDHCYGGDEDSLASVVGALLTQRSETLAVAESCTGGGLGHLITSVPGSSVYFRGGIISYDNEIKVQLLGVDSSVLDSLGAVSDEVAKQMAQGVRSRLGSTWGIGITGIAGPGGGTESKPVGLVYIGIAGPNNEVESVQYQFGAYSDRDWIRWLSACNALDRLRRSLLALSRA
ncbi:MAG: competence/damage-inducible protein A [Synechococcales cyanobacterium T60_A2020_003]|nr:competence/damage-inducible protein A [Synechococcales cyanobacterium T60_A2020_003]